VSCDWVCCCGGIWIVGGGAVGLQKKWATEEVVKEVVKGS
jgi:hypothetical protein